MLISRMKILQFDAQQGMVVVANLNPPHHITSIMEEARLSSGQHINHNMCRLCVQGISST